MLTIPTVTFKDIYYAQYWLSILLDDKVALDSAKDEQRRQVEGTSLTRDYSLPLL